MIRSTTSRTRRALAAGAACAIGASTKFATASPAAADPHPELPGGVREGALCFTQTPGDARTVHSAPIVGPGGPVGTTFLRYSDSARCVRAVAVIDREFQPRDGRCDLHAHVYKPSVGLDTATVIGRCDEAVETFWINDKDIQQIAVGLKYHNGNETAGGHTDPPF